MLNRPMSNGNIEKPKKNRLIQNENLKEQGEVRAKITTNKAKLSLLPCPHPLGFSHYISFN